MGPNGRETEERNGKARKSLRKVEKEEREKTRRLCKKGS